MTVERAIYKNIKQVIDSPEAIIITGMRRVGKTVLLHYLHDNIQSTNKIYLDLENPLNQKIFEERDYEKIFTTLCTLGLQRQSQAFLFLDEIQTVRQLPSVVKYLSDHYKMKFFLSGSASFYLKNLFAESLAGRKYIFELFPFSFTEFLLLKNQSLRIPRAMPTEAEFSIIDRWYHEYLEWGGFPGVILKESADEKKRMLEDIFQSYFQMEVQQLGDFRKTQSIRDLMLLVMERAGSKLDIQKIAHELGIARETLMNYLAFLESTYFIKRIRPYSQNRDVEIRSTPKIYICDNGLARHLSRLSEGSLFENSIFWGLQQNREIQYYRRKNGAEIDFIVDQKAAYEVKITATQRDVVHLERNAKALGLKKHYIVSRTYTPLKGVVYGFMIE